MSPPIVHGANAGPARARAAIVALVLFMLMILAVPSGAAESGRVPMPVLPSASLSTPDQTAPDQTAPDQTAPGQHDATVPGCVAPTEVMRREHMDFLRHQRDRTVYQAARGERYRLTGCVACHVSRDETGATIPINAPGQFCAECHAYAAVKMDCFECHATRPDSGRRHQ